jgi:hypothetical protein
VTELEHELAVGGESAAVELPDFKLAEEGRSAATEVGLGCADDAVFQAEASGIELAPAGEQGGGLAGIAEKVGAGLLALDNDCAGGGLAPEEAGEIVGPGSLGERILVAGGIDPEPRDGATDFRGGGAAPAGEEGGDGDESEVLVGGSFQEISRSRLAEMVSE